MTQMTSLEMGYQLPSELPVVAKHSREVVLPNTLKRGLVEVLFRAGQMSETHSSRTGLPRRNEDAHCSCKY